jgi:hypothetical protein
LECEGATSKGKPNFNSITCGNSAYFSLATFEGETSFAFATLNRNLVCSGATFKADAQFDNVNCSNSAFFNEATADDGVSPVTFEGGAGFGFASIGTNLNFYRAIFGGPVNLSGITVSQVLQLVSARATQYVDLYQSKMNILEVGSALPLEGGSRVNLRGCSFERLLGEPNVARALAKRQKPNEFSRDPYLHLER